MCVAIVLCADNQARSKRVLFEAMDLTALFLVGLMLALGRMLQCLLLLVYFDLLEPLGYAGLIFVVEQRRLLSRTALFIEIGNPNFPGILIFANGNQITGFDLFSRFTTLAVDVYLAAVDRLGGQSAGFKKARRPQPFIDADLVKLSQRLNHSPTKP